MTAPDSAPSPFPVEGARRLSQSLLWTLQRRYFELSGVEAWSRATVPHRVTNNPALAHAYARVFHGFLRDLHTEAAAPREPVTVVELGAGSGRFAFLFLQAMRDLMRRRPIPGARLRYVMTDFAEANLAHFRHHPALQPFVADGTLDFALFDAEEDREIRLLHAAETLSPGSLGAPLGVIANYVFDGIRQDAFAVEGGALQECLFSLSANEPAGDLDDPALLARLTLSPTRRPAPPDYYGDPSLDMLLQRYAAARTEAPFLFPFAAIRCLDRLAALASGRMLLLSADWGHVQADAVDQDETPLLLVHGSFSLGVNYHAIAEHVRSRHGQVFHTEHRQSHLAIAAFVLGEGRYPEARFAYEEAVERASPDDLFALRGAALQSGDGTRLRDLLSLIRLSHYDPNLLRDSLPALWTHVAGAEAPLAREVVRTILRAWERYYFIGEDVDFAFQLALLAHGYGGHREALSLFQASVRLEGDAAGARWNIGMCHYALGEVEAACACFAEAARMAPGFQPVGGMQTR